MPKRYAVPEQQNLKAVMVYYPTLNISEAALLDLDTQLLIGLCETPVVYHPVGGLSAIESIVESGLVPNSEVWGVECEHLYDEVYRLAKSALTTAH